MQSAIVRRSKCDKTKLFAISHSSFALKCRSIIHDVLDIDEIPLFNCIWQYNNNRMKIFQFLISVPNKNDDYMWGLSNPIPEKLIGGANIERPRLSVHICFYRTSRLDIMICYFKDGRCCPVLSNSECQALSGIGNMWLCAFSLKKSFSIYLKVCHVFLQKKWLRSRFAF